MNRVKWLSPFVLILSAGFYGCNAGGPIEVNSGYTRGVEFNGLGPNYSWASDPEGKRVGAPGLHEMIREISESQLAHKGFQPNPQGPDFFLEERVTRKEKTDVSVVAHGQTVEQGSLILEVIDAKTRATIWWGIARAKISDSDPPDVRRNRLQTAIRQLMEKFPPKAK